MLPSFVKILSMKPKTFRPSSLKAAQRTEGCGETKVAEKKRGDNDGILSGRRVGRRHSEICMGSKSSSASPATNTPSHSQYCQYV